MKNTSTAMRRHIPGRLGPVAALLLTGFLPSQTVLAQIQPRVVGSPDEVRIERPAHPLLVPDGKGNPVVRELPGREAKLTLTVDYSDPKVTSIPNPATATRDPVRLRTYNGKLVAPTVRVRPSETVRITLENKLPLDKDCSPQGGNINTINCTNFNITNLHGHGLWVSPTGNSDNVLLAVKQKETFQYEYNIPEDHPSGLYWYHPHVHGSTALQVASGMAGALIVEGTRVPTAKNPGDIDVLLRQPDGKALKEHVVLLQQIQYACRDKDNNIKTKVVDGKVVAWVCDAGDVGTIEGYDQFGPGSWQQSNRYTTLNGEVQPVLGTVQAGEVHRWRFVHAGVRDTINLALVKARPGTDLPPLTMGPAQTYWMQEHCGGAKAVPNVVQWQFAMDGQTMDKIQPARMTTFQPGYRTEFLTVFPDEGVYCVVDRGANSDSTVNAHQKSDQLLGFVVVKGGQAIRKSPEEIVRETLRTAARRLPKGVQGEIDADLKNLVIRRFAPHPAVADHEIKGKQELSFAIGLDEAKKTAFTVNGKPFNPTDFSRTLILGTAEEWTLTARNGFPDAPLKDAIISHPFHIHVNPFQVVKILNTSGVDITDPSIPREKRLELEKGDPQYLDMKGVWKDTVFVKQDYKVIVRTRYERYIGDFVLHCHILDHEDQGMMQMVRIQLDGGDAHGHGHAHGGH